jgi:4'-phosphopantetheinyl transferase
MELWLVDLNAVAPALEALERDTPRLSTDDCERARRLSDPGVRRCRTAAYAALRVVLERVSGPAVRGKCFIRSARGKPSLQAGPAFSFSHTERLALVGVARLAAIGVDLEESRALAMSQRRRDEILAVGLGLAARPAAGDADSHAAVLQAWCRLEAYAKARGLGISRVLTELGLRETRGRQLTIADIESATRQRASEAGFEVRDVRLPPGLHGAVAYAGSVAAPRLRHFPTDRAAIARLLTPARTAPRR